MRAESTGIQMKHVDVVKLGLPFFPTFTPISAMSTARAAGYNHFSRDPGTAQDAD